MNQTNQTAPRYQLGQSDTYLSPIGLGTWQFSQGQGLVGRFWPKLEPALMMSIVEEALNHGINWFDTAEVYGRGKSEEALAQALDDLRVAPDQVAIATKWWPVLRSARHLEATIDERRRRLHNRPITLYQIHQPYSHSSVKEQMEAMARLLDQGLIRHAGVSNFSAAQMVEAAKHLKSHGYALASNQVRYHLLDRRIEENGVIQAALDWGITIIAYSPLAQGVLTGKFHNGAARPGGMRRLDPHFRPMMLAKTEPLIEELRQMAQRYHVSPAQVALNWVITYPGNRVMAIPGATRVSQAAQNAGAMGWSLSPGDRQALTDIARDVTR
ncbi:aldo/keto reductase [Sulfobacillus harzensis]|uniref:Aldo/keto reductase n=1 Tax=Sulfobacillus harzensis TaxID=2729629 RepID=A0A7Y0L6W1_9FIRM|nr:aldo/keto reductase [Sulfobacillus harzensis]NMP23535.1 aldo/keto reductase [Sulfobacillus harzensis]